MKHLEHVLISGRAGGVETYRHNAARASCYQVRNGLWQADYTGPLCFTSAISLGSRFLRASTGAKATIERIDKSLSLFAGPAPDEMLGYLIGSPPGCIIVDEVQFAQTQAFCRLLAGVGVVRKPFRSSQLELALEWSAAMIRE